MSFDLYTTSPYDDEFPTIDDIEEVITRPPIYEVPGVDLESPPNNNVTVQTRRNPTNRLLHLLSFATDPLRNYVTSLANQARLDFSTPRPSQADLASLQTQLATAIGERDNLQARLDAIPPQPSEEDQASNAQQIQELRSRIEAPEADNELLSGQIEDNEESIQTLTTERDALTRTVSERDDQLQQAEIRINSLTDRIAQLESINPGDSISEANTGALTNPNVMDETMLLASCTANLLNPINRTNYRFATDTSLATAQSFAAVLTRIGRIFSSNSAPTRSDEAPNTAFGILFTHWSGRSTLNVQMESRRPPDSDYIIMILAYNSHTREEINDIAAGRHTTCRHRSACFIARTLQASSSAPRTAGITVLSLGFSEYISDDLRPRRYPVSLGRILPMLSSHRSLATISDIIARSSNE